MSIRKADAIRIASAFAVCSAAVLLPACPAYAVVGQISKLSDVSFTLLNPLVSTSSGQSVCAYSAGATKMYAIKATGSGTAGAFTLSGGGGLTLVYGVQWSPSSGASSGTTLTSGVNLNGQTSTATAANCTVGNATSASLIVTLAASDLQSAVAGVTYTGVLTLLLTAQ